MLSVYLNHYQPHKNHRLHSSFKRSVESTGLFLDLDPSEGLCKHLNTNLPCEFDLASSDQVKDRILMLRRATSLPTQSPRDLASFTHARSPRSHSFHDVAMSRLENSSSPERDQHGQRTIDFTTLNNSFIPMPQLLVHVPEIPEETHKTTPYPHPYQPILFGPFDVSEDEIEGLPSAIHAVEAISSLHPRSIETSAQGDTTTTATEAATTSSSTRTTLPPQTNARATQYSAPTTPAAPTPAPTSTTSRFQCPKCGKTYISKTGYERHMEKEQGIRYRCTIPGCKSKPFSRYDSIARHNAKIHPGQAVRAAVLGVGGGGETEGEGRGKGPGVLIP